MLLKIIFVHLPGCEITTFDFKANEQQKNMIFSLFCMSDPRRLSLVPLMEFYRRRLLSELKLDCMEIDFYAQKSFLFFACQASELSALAAPLIHHQP